MFKEQISITPLTDADADIFFNESIRLSSVMFGDRTLLATLRALVYPRMNKGDTLEVYEYIWHATVINENDLLINIDKENCFSVINLCGGSEYVSQKFKVAEEVYINNGSWYKLEKVTMFYRKTFKIDCYINQELQSVIVLVDSMDTKKYHYMQCSLLAMMPWYFNQEDGISDMEMKLIQSLREKTPDNYNDCIAEIAGQYDFRTMKVKRLLKDFELESERNEIITLESNQTSLRTKVQEYNKVISESLSMMNDINIRIMGLREKIAQSSDGDSEIMNYFLCNDNLELDNMVNSAMRFVVKTYLCYYDEDNINRVLENPNSYIYFGHLNNREGITKEQMKKLMTAIFIEEKLRVRVCAAYSLSIKDMRVYPQQSYGFSPNLNSYVPNPHINSYGCMGNYTMILNELMGKHDYIGAIEQCIASCQSLNFGDSTVMSNFMTTMYQSRGKYIELPDGNVVTTVDAIRWLEANEQEDITNKEEDVTNE